EGAAAAGGLAGTELASGVDDDAHAPGVDAELFDRHLLDDGMHALAHLGPAMTYFDGAVVVEAHDGPGHFLESVAQAGVLQPGPAADRLACRHRFLVWLLHGVEAHRGAETPVVHDLSWSPTRSGRDDIAAPHLPTTEARLFGEPVDDAFHR